MKLASISVDFFFLTKLDIFLKIYNFLITQNYVVIIIMKKFKYMVFDIDTVNEPEDVFLNKMGEDGWDLITINNEPLNSHPTKLVKLYFKKEILPAPDQRFPNYPDH